jgi:CheY-like chemotaxis protein
MRSARVLILKDDEGDVIRIALEPFCQVRFALKVSQAVQLLKTEQFDLIVARVYLPEENMFDFLHQVKSDPNLLGIPFICFAGTRSAVAHTLNESMAKVAKNMGAADYLTIDEFWEGDHCNFERIRGAIAAHLPETVAELG